ncbi:hypothetical protein CAPTEDRAFT_205047 [Capitella teleta]|uniref:Prokaryotic glutathione synthetase ATP-binding domain-containing protein n=1 Tax=Capitella teleta TaxID=283909 RepID=R7T991_CAPTE|nr:hypothetical protein CAPTEDRAFT_205047 [Capitella teleta]|eukprot:ELT90269.1 hypothetical protein CAPTEDRAFT_205047 [Capitella teleta]
MADSVLQYKLDCGDYIFSRTIPAVTRLHQTYRPIPYRVLVDGFGFFDLREHNLCAPVRSEKMSHLVALVTPCAKPSAGDDPFSRDDILIAELHRRQVKVESLDWDDPEAIWKRFDLVIIRSTPDYHQRSDEFIQWLTKMASDGVKLGNPYNLCKWNINKKYLKDFAAKGVKIVPTEFVTDTGSSLKQIMKQRRWNTAVIKPSIGANAFMLYKVASSEAAEHFEEILVTMIRKHGGGMVQLFMDSIHTSGEWSLVFFDGKFSHAANKVPQDGFKTQEQSADSMSCSEEPPKYVLRAGVRVIRHLPTTPLYARVDLMVGDSHTREVVLSELELIEPSLYLGHCKSAAARFADAIMKKLKQ